MANPYYVEPQRATLDFAPIVEQGLRLKALQQSERESGIRSKLMMEQNDLAKRGLQIKEAENLAEYGTPTMGDGGRLVYSGGLKQGILDVQRQTANTEKSKLPAYSQNFGDMQFNVAKKAIETTLGQGVGNALIQDLDTFRAAKEGTTGAVYQWLSTPQALDGYRQSMLDDIQKQLDKGAATPLQQKKLEMLQQALSNPESVGKLKSLVDQAFAPTAQSLALEAAAKVKDQNKVVGNALVGPDGKVIYKGEADWDAPYLDGGGNLLQRNKSTGKVDKVTSPPTGFAFQSDGQGGFTLVQGQGAMGGMTKPVQTKVQEKLLSIQDSIGRLEATRESTKPEYSTIDKRLSFLKTGWQQKLKGTPIENIIGNADPLEVEEAKKYWVWRQNAIADVNQTIKDLTGAAMNREEVPRLTMEMPNPGLGIFDGDAPDQFDSKLNNKIHQLSMVQARYVHYMKTGNLDPAAIKKLGDSNALISIRQMEKMINDEGNKLKSQGMDPTSIKQALKEKFFTVPQ